MKNPKSPEALKKVSKLTKKELVDIVKHFMSLKVVKWLPDKDGDKVKPEMAFYGGQMNMMLRMKKVYQLVTEGENAQTNQGKSQKDTPTRKSQGKKTD